MSKFNHRWKQAGAQALAALFCASTWAAVPPIPRQFTMQGVATGYSSPVRIDVDFYSASSGGTHLFSETFSSVSLTPDGIFNINVGSNTFGGIPDSAFAGAQIWVQLTFNTTDVWPRTQMLAVPFAIKSYYAENLVKPDSMDAAVTVDYAGLVNVSSDLRSNSRSYWLYAADPDEGGEGSKVELANSFNAPTLRLDGDNRLDDATGYKGGGEIELYNGNHAGGFGTSKVTMKLAGSDAVNGFPGDGNLELYDGNACLRCRLHSGRDASAGSLGLFMGQCSDQGSHQTVRLQASETYGEGAFMALTNPSDYYTIVLDGDQTGSGFGASGLIRIRTADDKDAIRLSAVRRNGEAEMTMFQTNYLGVVKEAVVIEAQDANGGGTVLLKGPINGDTDIVLMGGDQNLASNGRFSMYDNSGNEVVQITSGMTSSGDATLELRDDDGRVQIGMYVDYGGSDIGRIKTGEIEITGADVAERFPASETLTPGMVVAIDPEHAGKLCVARGAYNHSVAGVVSGANGLNVGAILGNRPESADAPPIALTGRVWVQCDATSAAIVPGDLLTTSDMPGHAMKATQRKRAHGAVIGKAMTSLEQGQRGLVLVLINLQ
ncbi:MAG: hypothetical protein IT449_13280 [Phycisphaerales bacterium]|nr:hypothetical protein [Phycisphaerales bacterium]